MIKQAFEALCVNELRGLEFECDTRSRSVCKRGGELIDLVPHASCTNHVAKTSREKWLSAHNAPAAC